MPGMQDPLDAMLDELMSRPVRHVIPLAEGEEPPVVWFGPLPPDGMRWETDAEFRARILAGQACR